MALAKLWNAVFGKRPAADLDSLAEPIASAGPTSTATVVVPNQHKSTIVADVGDSAFGAFTAAKVPVPKNVDAKPAPLTEATANAATTPAPSKSKTRAKAKARQNSTPVLEQPIVVPEPASVLRMFRRKNNAWTKLVGARNIKVILDLNVQDGSRAIELLEAIVDSSCPAPKYVAIGMFELAGEKLTVRQFHQKVRSAGGLPVVIPMPLVEGLRHMSQTIGVADLILLDVTDQQLADPVVARLLQRISSKDSLQLRRDGKDGWRATPPQSRAA